jgi:CcmD family protein
MRLIRTAFLITVVLPLSLSSSPGPESMIPDLYKVMGVILVAWLGLALFLFRLDRKLARLEKELKKSKNQMPGD